MMSRSCGVGQNLKAQENWGGDNHTRDLISETGMMESLHAISSCVLIAADAASQCQTRTKTLCKLLLPAAVQVSTSGQACSQDKKMYSKKKKNAAYTNTSCTCGIPPQGCTAGPQQISGGGAECLPVVTAM